MWGFGSFALDTCPRAVTHFVSIRFHGIDVLLHDFLCIEIIKGKGGARDSKGATPFGGMKVRLHDNFWWPSPGIQRTSFAFMGLSTSRSSGARPEQRQTWLART